MFAIGLSNKVYFNKENSDRYEKIYGSYEKQEQYIFYALSPELIRLFGNETNPYDILGEIYQDITKQSYLKLINNSPLQEIGEKLQGVINLNKKASNGKMVEVNCGSGAMILAYANTLNFFEISAVVILVDENTNKELMRLYTPDYENSEENLMAA